MSRKIKHIYLNFSSYDEYLNCPRKFAWSLVENLVTPNVGDNTLSPLFKGSLVHECIDAIYKGQDWTQKFDEMVTKDCAMYNLQSHRSGSKEHMMQLLLNYINHYKCPDDTEFKVSNTEQRLEMPLTPWLTFNGTIDKIVRLNDSDESALVDHKTSSNLSRFLFPTIAISDQFTGYLALAQANGVMTNKLIVDGICTAHKALKEGEGMFERYDCIRSQEQIDEWKERLIYVATQMKSDIETGMFIPKPPKPCLVYGSRCQFYDVCASVGSQRVNILRNDFVTNPSPRDNFRITWEN